MAADRLRWARRCCWSRWRATAGCAACRSCAVRSATCWPAAWSASCSARCWCTRSGWASPARPSPTSPGRRSRPALFLRALAPRGRRLASAAGRRPAPSWSSAATCCCGPPCSRCPSSSPPAWPPAPAPRQLGAHQIALQLFFFLALVLDAYAIAAQTLVGHALGGDRPEDARATARRVAALGAGHRAGRRGRSCSPCATSCCPLFTDDPAVLEQAEVVWWFLAGHAAAGRRRLRPRRRADGRRRRRLPAHGHDRLGAGRLPAAVACSPCRSAGGWPASGPGCACSSALRLVAVLVRVAGDRWLSGACDGDARESRRRRTPTSRPACCWSTSPAA